MYVIAARYVAKPGAEEEVLAQLMRAVPLTRAEPGCRAYFINQSVDEPRHFLLYEQFVDEAAFHTHGNQPYIEEIVRGRVWPLLESRERDVLHLREPQE